MCVNWRASIYFDHQREYWYNPHSVCTPWDESESVFDVMYLTLGETWDADDNDDEKVDFWPQIVRRRRATVHRADVFVRPWAMIRGERCEIVCTDHSKEIFYQFPIYWWCLNMTKIQTEVTELRTSTSSWDTFHIVGVFHLFVFINNKMRIEHHESFDCQQYSILFLITGHGNVLQNSTVKCKPEDF